MYCLIIFCINNLNLQNKLQNCFDLSVEFDVFMSSSIVLSSDHSDRRDVDGVQTLQSLPGNAQESQIKISRGEMVLQFFTKAFHAAYY